MTRAAKNSSSTLPDTAVKDDIRSVFPSIVDSKNLVVEAGPYKDKFILNFRELYFKASINNITCICTCSPPMPQCDIQNSLYDYEYRMSRQLISSRFMASIIGRIKANYKQLNIEINTGDSETDMIFIFKPCMNNTLKSYLPRRKQKNQVIEPLYLAQMAINLFSMLTDAHSMGVGLVNISFDTLEVSIDGSLYFTGFRYAVDLQESEPFRDKPWTNMRYIICPEKNTFKSEFYTAAADVYSAAHFLMRLMRKPPVKGIPLTIDPIKRTATLDISMLDPSFTLFLPVLVGGLQYDPAHRLSASVILNELIDSLKYSSTHSGVKDQKDTEQTIQVSSETEHVNMKEVTQHDTPDTQSEMTDQQTTSESTATQFWEVDVEKKKKSERINKFQMDSDYFKQLLDDLFSHAETIKPRPKPKSSLKKESIIEQKLLEMITHNKQPYKQTSPLPRNMMGPYYGKSLPKDNQSKMEKDYARFNRRGEMYMNRPTRIDQRVLSDSEYIILKEKELKVMSTITESKSSRELLETITAEINAPKYPLYYPRVLSKAIQQASYRDPYLAITIFELAKSKNIDSYIHGCTTEVYNTLLSLRWNVWGDLYGVLNLIEEMALYGIERNDVTQRTVFSIIQHIEQEGALTTESQEGVFWNEEERRLANLLKETVGKWTFSSR
ncbi:hypothetical protein BDB01DRAFT_830858 [Pilobolus umbonatus]|nr:hypothetical protein BDB01DRAFT_830858 [Pilobolus umbonatus]